MYYSLNGTLLHKSPGHIAVDCGGVGYRCGVSMNTLQKMPAVGEKVFVYTYLQVREDAMELYAFFCEEELNCFKQLLTVSGVGGKAALSILSDQLPEQLALCVVTGDYKTLQRAQGIGAKLAQRIVVDLKDKMGAVSGDARMISAAVESGSVTEEAVSALVVLGYSRSESATAIAGLDSGLQVEELIRAALNKLNKPNRR